MFRSACQATEEHPATRIPFNVEVYYKLDARNTGNKVYQIGVRLFVPKAAATPEELKTLIVPTLRRLDNERLERALAPPSRFATSGADLCSIQ